MTGYVIAYLCGVATVAVPAALFCGHICAWGE